MRKDRLYLFTFFGLCIVTFAIGYFNMNYMLGIATDYFLKSQVESGKREAKEISNLVQLQLESGLSKEIVIDNLQRSIENTPTELGFICMFDWSGVQICHPNREKIGRQILPDDCFVQPVIYDELNADEFQEILNLKTKKTLTKESVRKERNSEVIYLYPVKNTDWIVAVHADIDNIKGYIRNLKINFILVYLASGMLMVLVSLFIVRIISGKYEKTLENRNEGLSKEVLSLSKLNYDLTLYKEKINQSEISEDDTIKNKSENYKKRILTYKKDEIVSVNIDDIAFVYTENTITYIYCLDGKQFHSNNSLDELYSDFDKTYFFRANRQFILSIKSIDKIYKYGNSQLKVETTPKPPENIIVSKNKASEFKQWLSL